MRGAAKRCDGPAAYRADVPTCDMQQVGEDLEEVCAAPSLPRGNRLVARTKTSPGSGRSSSPSRVTPVALSRSELARYSGGAAPDSHRLPYPRSQCVASSV